MFDIGIKRVAAIVARALYMFGWGLFLSKSSVVVPWKKLLLVRVLDPSLVVCWKSLLGSHVLLQLTQLLIFSIFSRQTRSSSSGTAPATRSEPRSDYYTRPSSPTRPPNQTIRSSDHHLQSRPPVQLTTPDHSKPALTAQLPISTAYPTSWNGTGQVHSLWVGSRGVYRALDEPCKAHFPHTFGLKFPDFFSA